MKATIIQDTSQLTFLTKLQAFLKPLSADNIVSISYSSSAGTYAALVVYKQTGTFTLS